MFRTLGPKSHVSLIFIYCQSLSMPRKVGSITVCIGLYTYIYIHTQVYISTYINTYRQRPSDVVYPNNWVSIKLCSNCETYGTE